MKISKPMSWTIARRVAALGLVAALAPTSAFAQTGVDDDRVSLPEGPGSIEGVGDNVEIDPNMGSMSYGVSVLVPQGVNGMTPAVGLNYSSAAGSSVVGVGWSMPMKSIERMTSRGLPTYGAEDYFAADGGDELVLVSAKDGKQVYRERFEGSFIQYTWHDVGEGEAGYWTAEYKRSKWCNARAGSRRKRSAIQPLRNSASANFEPSRSP